MSQISESHLEMCHKEKRVLFAPLQWLSQGNTVPNELYRFFSPSNCGKDYPIAGVLYTGRRGSWGLFHPLLKQPKQNNKKKVSVFWGYLYLINYFTSETQRGFQSPKLSLFQGKHRLSEKEKWTKKGRGGINQPLWLKFKAAVCICAVLNAHGEERENEKIKIKL